MCFIYNSFAKICNAYKSEEFLNKAILWQPKVRSALALLLLISLLVSANITSPFTNAVTKHAQDDTSTVYLPVLAKLKGLGSIIGVEYQSSAFDQTFIKLVVGANLSFVRSNNNAILWSDIEPDEGSYNFDAQSLREAELFWALANNNDVKVIQIVRSTPYWARKYGGGASDCGPIAQAKFQAFANFMYQMVRRYSQAPYNIKYWEIGNEPDGSISISNQVFGCWGEPSDRTYYGGAYYGEMLKVVYPSIKAADPSAKVLTGGLLLDCDPRNPPPGKDCTAARFIEGTLAAGAGGSFDILNFHAYDSWVDGNQVGHYNNPNWNSAWNTTGPSVVGKTSYLRETLSRFGHGNKQLMNTESAIQCWCSGVPYDPSILDETKAVYMTQANATAAALGLAGNIWYGVQGWAGHETQLIEGNGQTNRAYAAISAGVEKFSGAQFIRSVTEYGGNIRGYEFQNSDRRFWVIWSLDGQLRSIQLVTTPTGIFDMAGNAQGITRTPSFTNRPIYIEFTR
jgi:hypothetical protein